MADTAAPANEDKRKDPVTEVKTEKKEGGEQKPKREKKAKKENATAQAPAGEQAAANPEDQEVEEDNTFKVFVGNLAFATTEDDLREYFNAAGKVVGANIIVRGTRSLGYGFISYDTEEEAKKAVELLDKSDLAGRQINVEQAKLKEAGGAAGGAAGGRVRGARGPARGGRGFGRGGVRGGGRGYFRGRGRGGFGGRRFVEEGGARVDEDEVKQEGGEEGADAEAARGGRGRGRGRGGPRGRRFPRGGRAPASDPASGETSQTTLFVANLPFKVTNEDLASIFKDYKVTSAHVVKLRNGRSKGFGFVEVESEEQQQKVLSELKNVVVDGRELVIKVALASQTPPAADEQEGEAQAETA